MGTCEPPRNRGVNSAVRFDLAAFTERFFAILDTDARFTGPGPVELTRMGHRPVAERALITYLAEQMYTKFDDGVKSSAKRAQAIRKFEEGELRCALTNCKFAFSSTGQEPCWLHPEYGGWTEDLEVDRAVFRRARAIISRILGSFPGWEAVLMHADFGPGATTRLSRQASHRSNKWGGEPHIGHTSSSLIPGLFEAFPYFQSRGGRGHLRFKCVDGNKLDWVPKNYKTDRTIAIEPEWSMFFQKGIGSLLRKRLKRVGQDLDTQETNKFLAQVGSIDGSLATLDLSMASDTVSYNVARYLIRPDWFAALDRLRSPIGFYRGLDGVDTAVVYEKLSSMGNGFTFEVETLIFYGLLRAVSELSEQQDHRLYVYGDDIVVPSGMASLAMAYLEKAGFVVNQDKSFWSGPFRESCGGHYFAGDDVTPFYVREDVSHLDRLFLLHNNVYRWFNRHPYICDPEKVRELLHWIRSFAPEKWRRPRLMTEDVGDGGFIGSFDEVCPTPAGKAKKRAGWEGWSVQTLQYRRKRDNLQEPKASKTARHPWGSFKPAVPPKLGEDEEHRFDYNANQDPVAVSLWSLEGNARRAAQMWNTTSGLSWATDKSFVDWLYPLNRGSASDTPLAERWWYVGTQVLPWSTGSSWW